VGVKGLGKIRNPVQASSLASIFQMVTRVRPGPPQVSWGKI